MPRDPWCSKLSDPRPPTFSHFSLQAFEYHDTHHGDVEEDWGAVAWSFVVLVILFAFVVIMMRRGMRGGPVMRNSSPFVHPRQRRTE